MIPYGCLATGQNVGMIEVVRNAKTVMHILKQDIRSAMMVRTKELHSWIKEKNRSPSAVDRTAGSSERYTKNTYISQSFVNNNHHHHGVKRSAIASRRCDLQSKRSVPSQLECISHRYSRIPADLMDPCGERSSLSAPPVG